MNTKKYKNMMFFDADTGGGEGGSTGSTGPADGGGGDGGITRGATAFEPVTKQTTGDRPLPGEKPQGSGSKGAETEHAEGVQDPPKAPAAFDPTKFATEFGKSFSESLKPVIAGQQPPAPKMTAEEARQLLKVWEPDDAWYAKYDNLETRKDAVAEMRDALVQQADTLNQFRMREAIDQLRQEFMPGLASVQETANQQRESRLHTSYPTLAKPEMQPLVSAIANDFVAKGQKFANEAELFKALATGVEAVMKVSNPEFKLETATNGSGQQTENGRSGRTLPVSTPGGGGGTGRSESGSKPEPKRGIAVFAK